LSVPRIGARSRRSALRAAEGDAAVDEWGGLSKLHEVSTAETMRRLAEEERKAGHKPW
jgi:hypothetical protein